MKNGMPVSAGRAIGIDPMAPIPWAIIEPHDEQARKNHGGQSLRRLAERGGLCVSEAVAILEDRPWAPMDPGEAVARLVALTTVEAAP